MWQKMKTAPINRQILIYLPAPYDTIEKVQWYNPWQCWIDGLLPEHPDQEQFGIGSQLPLCWQEVPLKPSAHLQVLLKGLVE